MYIFFFSRRYLGRLAMIGFLAVLFLAGSRAYLQTLPTMAGSSVPAAPIYEGDKSRAAVAFTFNVDWGEDYLETILDILADHNVQGTFFPTGRFAAKFPQLVAQIASLGHEIGNHGHSHPHVDLLDKQGVQADLQKAEAAITKVAGKPSPLYAPPYGEKKKHVVEAAAEIGYRTVLWTIDTLDWQPGRSSAQILSKVDTNLQNGAIILMHPTEVTARALPSLIKTIREREFELTTVSSMVAGE